MTSPTSASAVTQATISADAARRVVEAGLAKGEELGVAAVVAVVDASGVLKSMTRADGAALIGVDFAQRKAHTAVAVGGMPTTGLFDFISQVPPLITSMPNLPGIAMAPGGVPVFDGERLLGAVGVSGGTADQDDEIAQAAAAAVGG